MDAIEIAGKAIEGDRWNEQTARKNWEACFRRKREADGQLQANREAVAIELARCWDLGGGRTVEEVASSMSIGSRRVQQIIAWGRMLWHHRRLAANPGSSNPPSSLPPPPPRPGKATPTEHQARELHPVAHDPKLVAKVLAEASVAAEADAERRAARARLAGRNVQPVVTVTRRNVREAVQRRVPPTPADQAAEYRARVDRALSLLRALHGVLSMLDEQGMVSTISKMTNQVQALRSTA